MGSKTQVITLVLAAGEWEVVRDAMEDAKRRKTALAERTDSKRTENACRYEMGILEAVINRGDDGGDVIVRAEDRG